MAVHYKDIFGRDYIGSTTELVFSIYLAKELDRREMGPLSLQGVRVPKLKIDQDQQTFIDNAIHAGIVLSDVEKFRYQNNTSYEIDDSFLSYEESVFPMEGGFGWSISYAKTTYPEMMDKPGHLVRSVDVKYIILMLTARHLVDVWLGTTTESLTFIFDGNESKTGRFYNSVALLQKAIPDINDYIKLSLDIASAVYDYSIFLATCVDQGHNVLLSPDEKVKVMEEMEFLPGGIYVLWERGERNNNNPNGAILGGRLVRFDGIRDHTTRDGRLIQKMVQFTRLPEPRSAAERRMDYQEMVEEGKDYFPDWLSPKSSNYFQKEEIGLLNLCIHNYLYDEDYFLLKLETSEEVQGRYVGMPDDPEDVLDFPTMSAADFVYWTLKDDKFEFNEEVFIKNYYRDGQTPLYENYI